MPILGGSLAFDDETVLAPVGPGRSGYDGNGMNGFVVVIALLAVAAVGWLLAAGARRILRRHGIPTDERDRDDGR